MSCRSDGVALIACGLLLALVPWTEAGGGERLHLALDLAFHLLAWGLVLSLLCRRGPAARPVGLLALVPALVMATASALAASYGLAAWLRIFEWCTALALTLAVCGRLLRGDDVHRERLAMLVVLASAPAAAVALLQALSGERGMAGFVNPNHLGAWLAAVVPLALVLATRAPAGNGRPRAAVWLPAGALLLGGVLASGSRGAILGLLAGSAGFVVVSGLQRRWSRRRWLQAATLATIFAGLALATLALRFADGTDIYRYDRLRIWESTGAVLAESPWVGVGPGQFTLRAAAHNFPRTEDPVHYGRVFHSPHSHLLLWSVECGLLATLALAFGICASVRVAGRRWRDMIPGRPVAAGAAAGLAVLGAISLVDEPLDRPAVLIGAALLVALALPTTRERMSRPTIYRRALAVVTVSLAVLAGAVVPTASQDLAVRARTAPDARRASELYQRAGRVNPWQAYHPGEHAALMLSLAARPIDVVSYARIRVDIEGALALAPRESSFWVTRARLDRRGCIELFRDAATCRRSAEGYATAAEMAPKDARILREWATLARLFDDADGARDLLERAVELEPHYVAAWSGLLEISRLEGRAGDARRAEEALERATDRARRSPADSPYARAILGRGPDASPAGEGS